MVDVDARVHHRDLHAGAGVASSLGEVRAGHLNGRGQLRIGGRLGAERVVVRRVEFCTLAIPASFPTSSDYPDGQPLKRLS